LTNELPQFRFPYGLYCLHDIRGENNLKVTCNRLYYMEEKADNVPDNDISKEAFIAKEEAHEGN